jgi:3-oxoacyl-[acyl-carrier-protein] synthase II
MLLGLGPDGPVAGRRVAITGIGAISCCGVGTDALWAGLNSSPPRGERRVTDFDPSPWFGPKEVRTFDRFTQFSVAVAVMAL